MRPKEDPVSLTPPVAALKQKNPIESQAIQTVKIQDVPKSSSSGQSSMALIISHPVDAQPTTLSSDEVR